MVKTSSPAAPAGSTEMHPMCCCCAESFKVKTVIFLKTDGCHTHRLAYTQLPVYWVHLAETSAVEHSRAAINPSFMKVIISFCFCFLERCWFNFIVL